MGVPALWSCGLSPGSRARVHGGGPVSSQGWASEGLGVGWSLPCSRLCYAQLSLFLPALLLISA